jgi:hypothetical protein
MLLGRDCRGSSPDRSLAHGRAHALWHLLGGEDDDDRAGDDAERRERSLVVLWQVARVRARVRLAEVLR